MTVVATTDTGVRKAAVLLIQLGPQKAAAVMKHLSEAEVEAVTSEVARLERVGGEEARAEPVRVAAGVEVVRLRRPRGLGAGLGPPELLRERHRAAARRREGRRVREADGPGGGFEVEVEPDLSSAAPFLALAAVTGGRMRVLGWPCATSQPGERMRMVLAAMGARTELADGTLTVTTPSGLVAASSPPPF